MGFSCQADTASIPALRQVSNVGGNFHKHPANLKRKLLIFIITASIFFLYGCIVKKGDGGIHIYQKSNKLITANGYVVSKPVKFKLKSKFEMTDTTMLTSHHLYVNQCDKNSWFKFYKNGKVVLGYDSKIPFSESDKILGLGGYYDIIGTNIKIEISYTQTQDQWGNLYIQGEIFGDTLKFYRDSYSKLNRNIHHFTSDKMDPHPECHYYVLSKVPFKLKDPDW